MNLFSSFFPLYSTFTFSRLQFCYCCCSFILENRKKPKERKWKHNHWISVRYMCCSSTHLTTTTKTKIFQQMMMDISSSMLFFVLFSFLSSFFFHDYLEASVARLRSTGHMSSDFYVLLNEKKIYVCFSCKCDSFFFGWFLSITAIKSLVGEQQLI